VNAPAPRLLQRLRERKLVQWALAYLAGAWMVLQVVDLVGNQFAWPAGVMRGTTVLLGVGFFAALILAWYHGEQGRQNVSGPELLMLACVLAVAGAALTWVSRSDAPSAANAEINQAAYAGAGDAVSNERSIAVLPFVDMSAERDQEYFSDGITEEILNALAQVPGLKVSARTSSFYFKGKNLPVREIADRLGVVAVLEGSVRRAGNRVRITAQLIDARRDQHLWSQTFDRELEDIFAVQTEIARTVTDALRVRLASTAQAPQVERPTGDMEAYVLYLRGRYHFHRYTEPDLRRSIEHFEQALARDPAYARAWAGLSDSYNFLADFAPPPEVWPRAKEAARRALELDGTLAEAHTVMGSVLLWYEWDFSAAEQAYRRALELDARSADIRIWYSMLLQALGRHEESLQVAAQAHHLDPLSQWAASQLAFAFYHTGRYEEAITKARRALAWDADQRLSTVLIRSLWRSGRQAEAIAEAERALEQLGREPMVLTDLAFAYAVGGRPAEARRVLAEVERLPREVYVPPTDLAAVYGALGEVDRAFAALEQAFSDRTAFIIFLNDRRYDFLRSDPRLGALRRRVGLEP
jgi:TolB-like protein/Flp pilus assembly protein TadD